MRTAAPDPAGWAVVLAVFRRRALLLGRAVPLCSRRRAVALLAAAAVTLAACSTPPGTRTGPPAAAPSAAANAGLGNAPSPSTSPTAARAPQVVTEAAFTSPSGNIGCYLTREAARCDIAQKSWSAGAAPADCQLDWGSGVTVGARGEATFTCAGDTVLGAKDKLEYGHSLKAGDFRCDSETKAMRCENEASGHGFTLAKEQYNIF